MAETGIVLVHRVEQALLGALMLGGDPGVVRDVRPAHFSDDQHQAIYAAVTGQYRRGGLISRVRAWLARAGGLRVARAAAYAAELPGLCPRRGHLLAYGAMVLQARQPAEDASGQGPRETGGGPDGQLAGADSWLSSATGDRRSRARGTSQPGDAGGQLAPETERLARALAPVVARLRDELAAEGNGRTVAGVVPSNGFSEARRLFGREDLQDLVLASLMRYPGTGGRELVGRVPPEVFEAGGRRELYVVMAELVGRGLPVDALIVAWEAARRPSPQSAGTSGAREPTAMLALQLGEMQTVPGMAGHIGRGLLADHVLTQARGQDWTRQVPRRPDGASPDAHRAAAVTPGAVRAGQVTSRQQAGPGTQPGSLRRPPQPGGSGTTPRHG